MVRSPYGLLQWYNIYMGIVISVVGFKKHLKGAVVTTCTYYLFHKEQFYFLKRPFLKNSCEKIPTLILINNSPRDRESRDYICGIGLVYRCYGNEYFFGL